MDGLEAQYGGYFIKNIRKLAFFEKKMLKNLQVSKNILICCNMKNLLAGDIPYTTRTEWRQKATTYKNNKNLVVIKSHTIYKNDKITLLRGPLKENEELF